MRVSSSRQLFPVCLFAILAVACGGDKATGPGTFTDPAATQADLQAIDTVFGTAAFHSFTAATASLNPLGISALRMGPMLRALPPQLPNLLQRSRKLDADRVHAMREVVSGFKQLATMGLFPDSVLGVTFVYDTASDQYVSSARTGAPANGVRFILCGDSVYYNYPDVAVVEVGRLDLIDLSAASTTKLEVVVTGVGGTPTYLDETLSYSYSATASDTAFSVSDAGYITNGESGGNLRRLDFTVSFTAHGNDTSGGANVSISYTLNEPAVTVSLTLSLTYNNITGASTISIDLRFSRPNESVRITDSYNGTSETAHVYVNGHLYANYTDAAGWTDGSGHPLSDTQIYDLQAIFEDAIGAFNSIDAVLGPAETLFGFGSIGF